MEALNAEFVLVIRDTPRKLTLLMQSNTEQFEDIRDEAWKTVHTDAMECRHREALIARVQNLWDASRQSLAGVVPGSVPRAEARQAASALRMAEQALLATASAAMPSVAKGYTVEGLDRLMASLVESRLLIVRPMARMMSERDPDRRSADEFAHILVRRLRFEAGRPVITAEDALELPCPFDPEPAT